MLSEATTKYEKEKPRHRERWKANEHSLGNIGRLIKPCRGQATDWENLKPPQCGPNEQA